MTLEKQLESSEQTDKAKQHTPRSTFSDAMALALYILIGITMCACGYWSDGRGALLVMILVWAFSGVLVIAVYKKNWT